MNLCSCVDVHEKNQYNSHSTVASTSTQKHHIHKISQTIVQCRGGKCDDFE